MDFLVLEVSTQRGSGVILANALAHILHCGVSSLQYPESLYDSVRSNMEPLALNAVVRLLCIRTKSVDLPAFAVFGEERCINSVWALGTLSFKGSYKSILYVRFHCAHILRPS